MYLYCPMSFFSCSDRKISRSLSSISLNFALVSKRSSTMGMKMGSRKGTWFLIISTRSVRVWYLHYRLLTLASYRRAPPGPVSSSCRTAGGPGTATPAVESSQSTLSSGTTSSPPRRRATLSCCYSESNSRSVPDPRTNSL